MMEPWRPTPLPARPAATAAARAAGSSWPAARWRDRDRCWPRGAAATAMAEQGPADASRCISMPPRRPIWARNSPCWTSRAPRAPSGSIRMRCRILPWAASTFRMPPFCATAGRSGKAGCTSPPTEPSIGFVSTAIYGGGASYGGLGGDGHAGTLRGACYGEPGRVVEPGSGGAGHTAGGGGGLVWIEASDHVRLQEGRGRQRCLARPAGLRPSDPLGPVRKRKDKPFMPPPEARSSPPDHSVKVRKRDFWSDVFRVWLGASMGPQP